MTARGAEDASARTRNADTLEDLVSDGDHPVVSRAGWVYFGRTPGQGKLMSNRRQSILRAC